ncbi:Glu/Leu/Phe/Val family dehydrogenase [Planococcus salinus]|uniref:Glutamate dehydrogenase n=1 Tax=Planococcus salinus TaxID=1848460 RepID=A0A3M8P5X3_9BACL|nr:Glu/Leu/Phe/Val dehydrogenase [Planococcus salinus]RNF39079.1 Glu/Leu/Phe/Val dehydrogenase [Planococcus salinus]
MPAKEVKDGVEISNPLEIVQRLLEVAVDDLGLPRGVFEILKKPKRIMKVSIPVRMDDGSYREFEGFRSQHLDVLGPTKGGVRFHPAVTEDEVAALSMWMSLKAAILGIPYGGGKGGIVVNPKELSKRELEELSRGFIRELEPIMGPEKDIPAPDVNTTPEIMGWMIDEFSRLKGKNVPGTVTGKPIILGGSQGRVEATGRGVVFTIAEAAERLGLKLEGMTAVVQGFGNVGSITAKLLAERGVKVIGIVDAGGGVYHEEGLNIAELIDYAKETGTVNGFKDYPSMTNEELFQAECDILIPAALENQITGKTGPAIKAKIVAEAANGPSTPEGTAAMEKNGITVIPDILCNAGGVTVSYFEWVQNTTHLAWTEKEVNERLFTEMTEAFNDVFEMKEQKNCTMREAAYLVAVERIAQAMEARGWI